MEVYCLGFNNPLYFKQKRLDVVRCVLTKSLKEMEKVALGWDSRKDFIAQNWTPRGNMTFI